MKLTIFIIYGVHGDESIYGQYISSCLIKFIHSRYSSYNIKVKLLGPYSKWSSEFSRHFSLNLHDPNRQHTKEWDSCKTDLRSLIVARSIYQTFNSTPFFNVHDFLLKCYEQGVNIKSITTLPQVLFSDFLGYISFDSWKLELDNRVALEHQILEYIVDTPRDNRFLFFDVHAGIGKPGKLSLIYRTNSRLVTDYGCYLVDGLARDLGLVNADFYVLEAGLKGTKSMLDKIFVDFNQQSQSNSSPNRETSILTSSEYLAWQSYLQFEIESRFFEIFDMIKF